jgi:hypothetical protein
LGVRRGRGCDFKERSSCASRADAAGAWRRGRVVSCITTVSGGAPEVNGASGSFVRTPRLRRSDNNHNPNPHLAGAPAPVAWRGANIPVRRGPQRTYRAEARARRMDLSRAAGSSRSAPRRMRR